MGVDMGGISVREHEDVGHGSALPNAPASAAPGRRVDTGRAERGAR